MLVCPQCQFENPDTHKFCQKCGVSLTEVICQGCCAAVPANVERCPHCDTISGLVLRAILFPSNAAQSTAVTTSAAIASPARNSFEDVASTAARYLDAQHRYQLLEPLPDLTDSKIGVEVRVLDCQPYQPTLLNQLKQNALKSTNPIPLATDNVDATEQDAGATVASAMAAIPAIAQPYLSLQPELHPSLPQIHAAWDDGDRIILLLGDRLNLPLLSDVWAGKDVLPLQILHWLYQMTELWGVLQPHGCRQSLLELANLRVDEDQLLCLQRLYVEQPERPLQLKDLGRVWQLLFQMSQRTQLAPLMRLCRRLEADEISTSEELRAQFEAIANELQPTFASPAPSALGIDNLTLLDEEDNEPTIELAPSPVTVLSNSPLATAPLAAGPAELELDNSDDDPMGGDNDDVPTVVLPMKLIDIEDAGRSDVGRQRDHNEDCFSIQTEIKKAEGPSGRNLQVKGLYILCDGMGGHAGGEVASAMAVDTLKSYFETHWHDQLPGEDTIREAIYLANKSIFDLNQESDRSGSGRMGTTLVLVLVQDTQAAIAHVGDSRLYRFSRRRGLEQVTVDHEVGQREIQRGVEPAIAYARPDAYQLTQALGPRDENSVSPDVQFIELNEDLLLLLCSDGLTDNDLLETNWRTHLEPLLSFQSNLEQGVNQLIDLANQYNGHDNITAVVVRTRVRPNLEQLKP